MRQVSPGHGGVQREVHKVSIVSSRSAERSGQVTGVRKVRDAQPPGSSPAAAAHRRRGLPAGRSRVRGMSVCRRRPPAVARYPRLSGSGGAARPEREGWGQGRGRGRGRLAWG